MVAQTALEEAVEDGRAAKSLLQAERESTALLSKAREAAVQVSLPYMSQLLLELPCLLLGGFCKFAWLSLYCSSVMYSTKFNGVSGCMLSMTYSSQTHLVTAAIPHSCSWKVGSTTARATHCGSFCCKCIHYIKYFHRCFACDVGHELHRSIPVVSPLSHGCPALVHSCIRC